jgi:DNA-binding transcriptional LysR family regulator
MKQINSLEDELGLTLTVRTGNGIKLTNSGKLIYEDAKSIIEMSKKSIENAKKLEKKETYTITIGTSLICPCTPLMDLWYKQNENHNEFKLKIVPFDENHSETLSTLKNNDTELDFIVTPCDSQNWLKNFNFLKLGTYKLSLVVPYTSPLAKEKIIDLKTLKNEKIMLITQGDSPQNNAIKKYIEENCSNVELKNAPFLYDINVFNECVENGYLLISLECWNNIHPSLKNIPITFESQVPYGIIYSKNPSKSALKFLELIKNSLKK